MDTRIAGIIDRIQMLEAELEAEYARRRLEFAFHVKGRVVQFEERVLRRHRELRSRLSAYVLGARPLMLLTAPVIYSLVIPFALLDAAVTLYERVCFPVYGIPRVRRRDYLVLDRGQLAYLNAIERLNCAYCSYANGVIAFVREVGSRTEQYWCPIKHARRVLGAHDRYRRFADYGDAEAYHRELETLRSELRRLPREDDGPQPDDEEGDRKGD